MKNKTEQADMIVNKLKKVMNKALKEDKYEKSMAAISAGCGMIYYFNQKYTDADYEEAVIQIAQYFKTLYKKELMNFSSNENTVLFYDGFGLDTRGVAKMYINALARNKYNLVYVTKKASQNLMPDTVKLLKNAGAEIRYVETKKTFTVWVIELITIILQVRPKAMFFYTTPNDSAGAVAFSTMEGLTDRFLIDLTDHAFWLGVNANDYFCGSREMSASNQIYERNIPRKKLIKLGVNLLIENDNLNHDNLPFDVRNTRYVFSGGQLYKTLGDENHYYYRIVDHILSEHEDIKFLYAGVGDRSKMDEVLEKYPNRAFLIDERKDFYYLIQHCTIYLNTYPMFGGMMMKYSANAGKIPVTLKHESDSDGLLIDQGNRRIEYETFDELIVDVDKLLNDSEYLAEREALLKGSVITEERFIKNVRLAIEEHHTDYEHGGERIDTSKFKQEFYDRFDINTAKDQMSSLMNRSLFMECPWMVVRWVRKLPRKIARNLKVRR